MEIVFVGAGRLSTQLARALQRKGHTIAAVYSHTLANAEALCHTVGGFPTDSIDLLPLKADAFVVAVKDAVLPELIPQLEQGRQDSVLLHTAGSVSMAVFGQQGHHGVLYPMQTFSKERQVDFTNVPFFVETNDEVALEVARSLAQTVTTRVLQMDSESRRYLHLAAVFACNFANHSYALAAKILEQHGMDFDLMLPLIDETAQKVHTMLPRRAQTGPAVRYDETVMAAHLTLLEGEPLMQQVYQTMSNSIHSLAND